METEAAAPAAVAPPIEEKLVEISDQLGDVVQKFDIAFGPAQRELVAAS